MQKKTLQDGRKLSENRMEVLYYSHPRARRAEYATATTITLFFTLENLSYMSCGGVGRNVVGVSVPLLMAWDMYRSEHPNG